MIRKRGKHHHLDVVVDGVRYREALGTTDWREAQRKEKDRIAEIKAGRIAAPAGRAYSRLPFGHAADVYQEERRGRTAERTAQFESERLKPLRRHFGEKIVRTIKAEDIAAYQNSRIREGVRGRTVNMETGVLRRILKKAKQFAVLMDFPKPFPEHEREIGKALSPAAKAHLFQVAASRPSWMVAHCAAVLAATTTCRGVELRNLRQTDVDLAEKVLRVRRSKTAAGRREIPLVDDAVTALERLRQRSAADGHVAPEHYLFPTCEHAVLDPTRPQKSWRTAWRALVREASRQAGRQAAQDAFAGGGRLGDAKRAFRLAAAPFVGLRFHDLRHQAITEMAENGTPESVIMSIAGHMSRRTVEHYSHVRRAAKREALSKIGGGLIPPSASQPSDASEA